VAVPHGGGGGGTVLWDFRPGWAWVLDAVVTQGCTALAFLAACALGAAGRARAAVLTLAGIATGRTAVYLAIAASLAGGGPAGRAAAAWGGRETLLAAYLPRLAVYALVAVATAREGSYSLDAILLLIGTLNSARGAWLLVAPRQAGDGAQRALSLAVLGGTAVLTVLLVAGEQAGGAAMSARLALASAVRGRFSPRASACPCLCQ
jgi:hypothetical protein